MRTKLLLLLLMSAILATGTSMAQGPKRDVGTKVPLPNVPDRPASTSKDDQQQQPPVSLSIDVDLINLDVVVTDNNNNPISGLEKQHFKVFDDNVEQTITNFSPTDAPLTVVILCEFGDTFGYYYDDVVGPAAGFINSLRPDDWAALVAFDIRPEILTDFTKDKNQLFAGLQRMRIPAYRETSLYDAVYDTLQRLDNVDGKKAVFLLATGLDTLSKHTYNEALRKAETSDTMIYAVGMGQLARLYLESRLAPEDNITFLQADNVMRSMAEATGGKAFFPRFVGEYPSIYQMVSASLRNQYSIGFVPKVRKTDGKLHKLRVEVPPLDVNKDGKPDKLKVFHKKGYYAPKS
jgi:VWFA-related protein